MKIQWKIYERVYWKGWEATVVAVTKKRVRIRLVTGERKDTILTVHSKSLMGADFGDFVTKLLPDSVGAISRLIDAIRAKEAT